MKLSQDARTRLVVLNIAIWAGCAVLALAVLGGPRGAIEAYLQPIDRELGGWFGLVLCVAGWDSPPLPAYEIAVAPRVIRAAELLGGEGGGADGQGRSKQWWFPGQFQAGGEVYAVDLQLAGVASPPRPLHDQAWRVRFREKSGYRGMGALDLSPARPHRNALDAVARDTAREFGLLAPPGGFASLRVNGAEAGVVFWSEGSSDAMLERLGYPEGEILTPRGSAPPLPLLFSSADEMAFGVERYVPAIHRAEGRGIAVEKLGRLLELTRNASDAEFERRIPQLLDIEKYLGWNALVWMFGDPNADGFLQLSWYFDPITGLLEPVVRDLGVPSAQIPAGVFEAPDASRLTARLLRSDHYRAQRNRLLWKLVGHAETDVVADSEERLGSLLTRLARADGSLARLGELREHAEFRRATRAILREKAASLRELLSASEIETLPVLGVDAGTPTLTLELAPRGLAEILLTELRLELGSASVAERGVASMSLFDPKGEQRRVDRVAPVVAGSSVTLRPEGFEVGGASAAGATGGAAKWKVEVRLPFFSREEWNEPGSLRQIEVAYRNAVTGEALPTARIPSSRVFSGADTAETEFHALFRPIQAVIAGSGLPLRLEGDELVLPAGSHVLSQTLVVPPEFRLKLEAGVELRLGPDVSVIGFRGITARGTAERPIRIRPADPSRPWGAIAVARASELSMLEFLTVSGGSRAAFDGIDFGGQLSFNASAFVISDSEVYGAQGGDGLSARRALFAVNRSQFVANDSDGLDSEWSRGTIRESLFVNNGDDGLDLADSRVNVQACGFFGMGDKSISAGERSQVAVSHTRLVDSDIAIASKEGSRVDALETEFRRNRVGFSLYRGKPIFGGGLGTVTGGVFARNERDFSVEPGSNLKLIGVHREPADPTQNLRGTVALRAAVSPFREPSSACCTARSR